MTADVSARIVRPLALWMRETHGELAVKAMIEAAGLEPGALEARSGWLSLTQLERMLAYARTRCPDDDAFKRACAHRLVESYGPMRFLLSATSPRRVFEMAARTVHVVSRFSTGEVLESDRTTMVGRIESSRPISRLVCLSRQAQMAAMPTLWGLPPARISERQCQAQGDDACVYRIEWLEHRSWLPAALGLLVGALSALLLHLKSGVPLPPLALLPLTLGLLGHVRELRRTSAANLRLSSQTNDALAEALRDDAEARTELLELHQRQREWVRVIEEQVSERTEALHAVAEHTRALQANQATTLLGLSHDLRNPMTFLKSSAEFLQKDAVLEPDAKAAVEDLVAAIGEIEGLVKGLMTVAHADANLVRVAPQRMEVGPLSDRLRRRLKALVHGREIAVTVFPTREAPVSIETDPLIFDRVMDNILSNAAKYTTRGSILVEIGGIPGFLTIKVSDTGRGMAEDQIGRIFHQGGSDSATRAANSYGVGLSVVVRLLAQVGGKLDVMSKVDSGTTFWVHLPIEISHASGRTRVASDPPARLVERVVTIRRLESA